MFDVITFGSATQDVYLISKKFFPVSGKKFFNGKGLCVDFGSKLQVEDTAFCFGGGGTNTAATFAKQGLKVAYFGKVGNDYFGNLILNDLKSFKINTGLVLKSSDKKTNISVVLTYPGEDKTILVYRGASDCLDKKEIPWNKIKNTKWFYLAPFSGKLANLTEDLLNFAEKNNIKIAMNPGYKQLILSEEKLIKIFEKIDILILNREEASLITNISYKKEKEIFKKLDKLFHGICVMTKGINGVAVSDGKRVYNAKGIIPKKTVDSTGAGDSFGSAFVSEFIRTQNVISSIQIGVANASSNIEEVGAREGLLKKNQKFKKVKVSFIKI
ncbi:carbohydrate kinase family protein [Patescibacteria group bacterium]